MNHGRYELVIKRTKRYDFSYELRGICVNAAEMFESSIYLSARKWNGISSIRPVPLPYDGHLDERGCSQTRRWQQLFEKLETKAAAATTFNFKW